MRSRFRYQLLWALAASAPALAAPPDEHASGTQTGIEAQAIPPSASLPVVNTTDDLGLPLDMGQVVRPIDLATALRLAGARDLDLAIARQRVCESLAELDEARVLWLPSLYLGPSWTRHDGQLQTVQGAVTNVSKSSLFVGGTAAAGQSATGPLLAGGPGQLSGLTSIIRISSSLFRKPRRDHRRRRPRSACLRCSIVSSLAG